MAYELVNSGDPAKLMWQDPANLGRTVVLSNRGKQKNLAGNNVKHQQIEIVINDIVTTDFDGVDLQEALSCRLKFSGSPQANVELSSMVQLIADTAKTWDGENLTKGFNPTSVPATV